jgi:hypothetical protein
MTDAKNPLSPLCDDTRLIMPDISKLAVNAAKMLNAGGFKERIMPTVVNNKPPVPTPAQSAPTAKIMRPASMPKVAISMPSMQTLGRGAANVANVAGHALGHGMEAVGNVAKAIPSFGVGKTVGTHLQQGGQALREGLSGAAPGSLAKAPAVMPGSSQTAAPATSQGTGAVAAAAHESGQPSPAGVHPAVAAAKGVGYRKAMGVGAGLGAAEGFLNPGEERDENGNVVHKSRIGGALHGAATGAGAGAVTNFAKNRVIGSGLLNNIPHSAMPTPHAPPAAAPHAVAPVASAPEYQPRRVNATGPAAPTAGRPIGADAGAGVEAIAAGKNLVRPTMQGGAPNPIFKASEKAAGGMETPAVSAATGTVARPAIPGGAETAQAQATRTASADMQNAEKCTDPELNPEASKKLPYKVPSLKLKK